jgi:phage terminase small subunit
VIVGRAKNKKADEACGLYKQGLTLADIARRLELPEGTVRRWKSVYKWDSERSDKTERSKKKTSAISKLDASGLTDKQKLFCIYYVKSFNATKAYQKAYGCSYETALTNGSATLGNTRGHDEIIRLKQHKLNQALLAPEDIFQKYMDIAFADITDFLDFGQEEVPVMGPFGPIILKDEETGERIEVKKVVNTVRFKESSDVDGTILSEVRQGKDGASIKLADRMKALDWLTNHMDMATEEQRARIDALRAKAQQAAGGSDEENDDGFIDALSGKVDEVWQDD